ncbi:ABC transporter substrate-binding protein [Chlorogloeopsis sp. ULAP02]|uniref:ABC transporter substrate-binding protein n=1 Tax=Chlorogloeopsis sp. ULAP02 TaxID=3107926 RepID=UPI00313721B8
MKKQPYRLIKPFLLMALSLLLITACYQPIIQKSDLSPKPSVECRIIQHKSGKTCVPLKSQRIIALEPESVLDPMLALGIKPIGYAAYNSKGGEYLPAISSDEITGATNVGSPYQPSLEKILMLKPDLILAADYGNSREIYELLSAIAPTVSVPVIKNYLHLTSC